MTPPKSKSAARMEGILLVEQIVCQRMPQLRGQPQGLDVDALVVPVEHHAIVLEAETRAEQAEAVGSCAGTTEETRVGGAHSEKWNGGRALVELLCHAAQCIPQRSLD